MKLEWLKWRVLGVVLALGAPGSEEMIAESETAD